MARLARLAPAREVTPGELGPDRGEESGVGGQVLAVQAEGFIAAVLLDAERVGEAATLQARSLAADVDGAIRHPAVEQVALDLDATRGRSPWHHLGHDRVVNPAVGMRQVSQKHRRSCPAGVRWATVVIISPWGFVAGPCWSGQEGAGLSDRQGLVG